MKKKGIFIARQLLLGIVALQVLNLSVGSVFAGDNDYDYSYTYNTGYDPTESAVEWIVELNYGQQPGFSYDTHEDGSKCLVKTFHWKTDLQRVLPEPEIFAKPRRLRIEIPARPLLSPTPERVSPPPEATIA